MVGGRSPAQNARAASVLTGFAVRRYLTLVETIVSSKGQIVLPALLRVRDKILTGQRFSVHRLRSGDYRLVRQRDQGYDLVTWLKSCPEKNYFKAPSFKDTTADIK